jgi:DNA-binding MurR/RpiR family transcriptional regulator
MSYSADPCYGYANRHVAKIDQAIYHIRKNLEQADFDNAVEREDAAEIVERMVRRLERLKADIGSVGFE